MSFPIQPPSDVSAVKAAAKTHRQPSVTDLSSAGSVRPSETVTISQKAQELAELSSPPKPDMQKVELLRQRIERGEYRPDSAKIAENILGELRAVAKPSAHSA